jgi:DNA-binding transcriptional MocR family regulator
MGALRTCEYCTASKAGSVTDRFGGRAKRNVYLVSANGLVFLGVRLPENVDLDALKALTAARGIYYAEGKDFHVEGKAVHFIRLAFGHVPDAPITQCIPVLAECIARCHQSNASGQFARLFDD